MDGVNLFKDFVCNALIHYLKSNNDDFRQCTHIMCMFGFRNVAGSIDRYVDTLGEKDV